jgi:hypothetical protein
MELGGPTQVSRKDRLDIKIKLKHERSASSEGDVGAFTFHTFVFTTLPSRGHLQRRRNGKVSRSGKKECSFTIVSSVNFPLKHVVRSFTIFRDNNY